MCSDFPFFSPTNEQQHFYNYKDESKKLFIEIVVSQFLEDIPSLLKPWLPLLLLLLCTSAYLYSGKSQNIQISIIPPSSVELASGEKTEER